MHRREFIGTAVASGVAGLAYRKAAIGQAAAGGGAATRAAAVERLYKAPDTIPNALEAANDGLWIADQVSERVFRVDWASGAVLHEVQSESHNTSGLAVGGGYLWLNANGAGTAAQRREARPSDRGFGEILQADMNTGRTIRAYRPPWRGGVHGATYVHETNTLWSVALNLSALAELDPRDDYRILRIIPVRADTPHGIAWYDGSIWCMFAGDRLAQRLDPESGRVIETYTLTPDDPDPHGMCIHNGYMYYCDAGLGGGRAPNPGAAPSFICRFPLA